MSSLSSSRPRARNTPKLDEGHWRAAADEGARLAAKQWRIPLANITEMALVDIEQDAVKGPCYVFKALYTDGLGQRRTGAVYMPQNQVYSSALSMSMLGWHAPCANSHQPSRAYLSL